VRMGIDLPVRFETIAVKGETEQFAIGLIVESKEDQKEDKKDVRKSSKKRDKNPF